MMNPDLSNRPSSLTVEGTVALSPDVVYRAWSEAFDEWFAAEGSLYMRPEVGIPYFFETEMDGRRHPHYGRFLKLAPNELVEMTWMTGDPGTHGAETVVTVELSADGDGTRVRLTHKGFFDDETMEGHRDAWPLVLEHLENRLSGKTE